MSGATRSALDGGRMEYCPVCDDKTIHYSEPDTDVSVRWWCSRCQR